MSSNYVCIKPCFINRRFLPGDVVEEDVQKVIPTCFKALKSRSAASMKNEIEDIVPEMAETRIKPVSMSELKGKTPDQFV